MEQFVGNGGLVGMEVEYEMKEFFGNNYDRVDGYLGTVRFINSYVINGEHICEAIIEQCFPTNCGTLDTVEIHKMRILNGFLDRDNHVLRVIEDDWKTRFNNLTQEGGDGF